MAETALGGRRVAVRRFPTGAAHHVFEVVLDTGDPVVVRAGVPERRAGLANGARLNTLLRPLGVPLPALLAQGLDQPLPWVILRRLPGTDLGNVVGRLTEQRLQAIAERVAECQAVVARLGLGTRHGYAVAPEAAPHGSWSLVPQANLARSRARILAAGLFGLEPVEAVAELLARRRVELDAMPAVPFLHDTTTRNVIVTPEGALSGIVDVDDLCFGDPRYAPALTLASLVTAGHPASYAEAWMRAAGHRDDGLFRLYVALFLVDFMGEHGQRFNGNEQPSTPRARARLLRAFSQAMRRT